MLIAHACLSTVLCGITILVALLGYDGYAIATLAGASFVTDGAWGGFYYWKAKNENRSKYAMQFINEFAERYDADTAIRIMEVVLKE